MPQKKSNGKKVLLNAAQVLKEKLPADKYKEGWCTR
jgi:hypothetical protein